MTDSLTDVYIAFDENSIVVKSGSLSKEFKNVIAIDNETNKIIGIGENEEEISAYDPERWKRERHKIVFEPIYNPENFNPENMYWALTSLVRGVVQELRGFSPLNTLNCQASIPGYEICSEEAKDCFEYGVQISMHFRDFIINGNHTGLEGWKIRFAEDSLEWGRTIGYAIPILAFALSWLMKVDLPGSNAGLLFVMLVLASMAIMVWIVEIIWLAGMQRFLPKKYIRWIFDGQTKGKWFVSRHLASLILGEDFERLPGETV